MNPILQFQKMQKIRSRISEIVTELRELNPRENPGDYNSRAKLSAELKDLQAQLSLIATNSKQKIVAE